MNNAGDSFKPLVAMSGNFVVTSSDYIVPPSSKTSEASFFMTDVFLIIKSVIVNIVHVLKQSSLIAESIEYKIFTVLLSILLTVCLAGLR